MKTFPCDCLPCFFSPCKSTYFNVRLINIVIYYIAHLLYLLILKQYNLCYILFVYIFVCVFCVYLYMCVCLCTCTYHGAHVKVIVQLVGVDFLLRQCGF